MRGRTAALGAALALGLGAAAGDGELAEALRHPGDPGAGEKSYALCAACHGPDAGGRPDGIFPVLAGQHVRVLAKQMVDMRAGRRENPLMHPYARTLAGPDEIADLAAYLSRLPPPEETGTGPGDALERGRELYTRDCASCHGERGQGDPAAFVPAVAGQHYRYLLRQLRDVAAGRRDNAHPGMQEVVVAYRDAELRAVADFASRLPRERSEPEPTPDPKPTGDATSSDYEHAP